MLIISGFKEKRAMSFPKFPEFRKLLPDDRDTYLAFYREVDPYSDFSFNNLIIWLDLRDDLEVSSYGRCVILRFSNPFEKGTTAYSVLGKQNCLPAVEAIFDFQQSQGQEAKLVMVPECVVSDMLSRPDLPQNLVITASSDHRDYLYDTAEVTALHGKRFHRPRRNISAFHRNHPDGVQVGELDLSTPFAQNHLFTVLNEWKTQIMKNDPLFDDVKALQRHVQFQKSCPAECLGFFLDGKLIGYSIYHFPPQPGWAIMNHLKSNRDVEYSFDYIFHTTLQRLHDRGIKTVNAEQDLGLPGLRMHKLQLGPVGYLYRYDISRL
jgi:hypothetical protein